MSDLSGWMIVDDPHRDWRDPDTGALDAAECRHMADLAAAIVIPEPLRRARERLAIAGVDPSRYQVTVDDDGWFEAWRIPE